MLDVRVLCKNGMPHQTSYEHDAMRYDANELGNGLLQISGNG